MIRKALAGLISMGLALEPLQARAAPVVPEGGFNAPNPANPGVAAAAGLGSPDLYGQPPEAWTPEAMGAFMISIQDPLSQRLSDNAPVFHYIDPALVLQPGIDRQAIYDQALLQTLEAFAADARGLADWIRNNDRNDGETIIGPTAVEAARLYMLGGPLSIYLKEARKRGLTAPQVIQHVKEAREIAEAKLRPEDRIRLAAARGAFERARSEGDLLAASPVERMLDLHPEAGTVIASARPGAVSPLAQGLRPALGGAWDALQEAARNDYTVAALEKDGRIVVLLGETHVKDKDNSEIGKKVLQHFDYRGIESANFRLLIGGALLHWFFFPFLYLFAWFSNRKERSTIHDAESQAATQAWLDEHIDEFLRGLGPLNAERAKRLEALLDVQARTSTGSAKLALEELKKRIRLTLAVQPRKMAKTFKLEEGHKPDLAEQLESLAMPFSLALLFLQPIILLPLVFTQSSIIHALGGIIGYLSLIFRAYRDAGDQLKRYERRPWFRLLFPAANGFLTARDRTMAANIDKHVTDEKDMDKMLVIVGKRHMPGITRLLEDYGFRNLAFPSPPEKAAPTRRGGFVSAWILSWVLWSAFPDSPLAVLALGFAVAKSLLAAGGWVLGGRPEKSVPGVSKSLSDGYRVNAEKLLVLLRRKWVAMGLPMGKFPRVTLIREGEEPTVGVLGSVGRYLFRRNRVELYTDEYGRIGAGWVVHEIMGHAYDLLSKRMPQRRMEETVSRALEMNQAALRLAAASAGPDAGASQEDVGSLRELVDASMLRYLRTPAEASARVAQYTVETVLHGQRLERIRRWLEKRYRSPEERPQWANRALAQAQKAWDYARAQLKNSREAAEPYEITLRRDGKPPPAYADPEGSSVNSAQFPNY